MIESLSTARSSLYQSLKIDEIKKKREKKNNFIKVKNFEITFENELAK